MGWILSSWDGEEELWKVFWVYGALFIMLAIGTVTGLRLFTSVDLENPSEMQFKVLMGLEGAYCVWMVVSLWRCSFNNEWSIWGYCTRVMVLAYVALYCVFASYDGKMLAPKDVAVRSYTLVQEQAEPLLKKYGIIHEEKQGGA